MATDYCLLTWAGKGTTVTFTDAGDIVNWTNHGGRTGQAFRLTTTGALPTGLSTGTTYYLREGADANTFTVYPTLTDATNGTNQVTFTGTGSGTNQVVGEYWASRTTEQKTRWGTAGSERVYGTMIACAAGVNALTTNYFTDLEIEIYDAFTDNQGGAGVDFSLKWRSITIHSRLAGARTPAFHNGVFGSGYKLVTTSQTTQLVSRCSRSVIDGLEFNCTYNNPTYGAAIRAFAIGAITRNNLISGGFYGIWVTAIGSTIHHNIVVNATNGFFLFGANTADTAQCYNNIAAKCVKGFIGSATANACFTASWNNIAIGCTTPWENTPVSCFIGYNASDTGTPWGDNAVSMATDFTDFTDYANNDFCPASGLKPQVNAGTYIQDVELTDVADDVTPNYESATYPNNIIDIGAYEYDHGEGLAPSTVNITIDGMANGSVIAIYKTSDMSVILSPTTTTGTYAGTFIYTADTGITVRVRKGTAATKYLPYEYQGTITSSGFALTVSQIPDPVA